MRKPPLLIGALLVSAALAAGPASAQAPAGPVDFKAGGIVLKTPAAAGALAIPELQLTTQVAFGRPVDRAATFRPDQPAVFAWFRWTGARPGSPLTGRLVFLAPAGDIQAAVVSTELAAPEDVGFIKFSAPSDGWPEGRYRLELSTNGAALTSQEFTVARSR